MKYHVLLCLFTLTSCRSLSWNDSSSSLAGESSFACDISMHSHDYLQSDDMTSSQDVKQVMTKTWGLLESSAMLSRLTYDDPSTIRKTARKWNFSTSQIIESESMLAAVFANDHCVFLAFRGTDFHSMRDWMVDANVRKHRLPSGNIHKGFFKAFMDMRLTIDAALQSANVTHKSFYVTGHSLGGALAAVYAYENSIDRFLDQKGPYIDHIVTFGQPLIADIRLSGALRSEFWGRYYRVVNGNDIVARVPNWFRHFGSLIWFHDAQITVNKEGNHQTFGNSRAERPRKVKISEAEIPAELTASKAAFREFLEATKPATAAQGEEMVFGGVSYFDDHSMDSYLQKVELGHQSALR